MTSTIFVRTTLPIFLLLGLGFLSRRINLLRSGDERVLSAYVYYFALPALFFINMSEIHFTSETLRYMLVGDIPILIVVIIYVLTYLTFRFKKNTLYLLILSTIFGSLAFFGIPFIMFAFSGPQGEHLATLSAAFTSILSVPISITVLELYKLERFTMWTGLKTVASKLSRNPLILSIFLGMVFSLLRIEIPHPLSTSLHMLGGTTSAVAIFMLGVFLYGRKYTNIAEAFTLSSLRIILLPVIAVLTTMFFNLTTLEKSIIVLMQGMPIATSMIVLSERYDFYKDTIPSLILISSLVAGISLNLWLLFLGQI